jgi:putative DNA methylase
MLAVVMLRPGEPGRQYRVPGARDYVAVRKAQERVATILERWEQQGKVGFCPFPDEPLRRVPVTFGVINVWVYGMLRWGGYVHRTSKGSVANPSSVHSTD